eukprot:scaffold1420_cov375-Pavlova_lutheri.AAC.25
MAPPTPSRQARKTGQEARHLGFPCKSRNGSENFDRGEPKGEREDGTGFEGDVVSELGRLNDRGMGFGFHRHLYPNSFRMCSGEGFPSIGPSIQDPIDPPYCTGSPFPFPRSKGDGQKGVPGFPPIKDPHPQGKVGIETRGQAGMEPRNGGPSGRT